MFIIISVVYFRLWRRYTIDYIGLALFPPTRFFRSSCLLTRVANETASCLPACADPNYFFGSIIRRTLLGWLHRTPRNHCHSQHPCQHSSSHYAVLADLSMVSSRNLPMSQAVWSLTIPMVASASSSSSTFMAKLSLLTART